MNSALLIAIMVIGAIIAVSAVVSAHHETYSTGYQIGPHYLGNTTWGGTPNIFTDHMTSTGSTGSIGPTDVASLVYTPPFTQTAQQAQLEATNTNWAPPDGGTYGLPPASNRPDFWEGPSPGEPDLTVHTYHMRNALPPQCGQTPREQWRTYGGARGWTFSPYY